MMSPQPHVFMVDTTEIAADNPRNCHIHMGPCENVETLEFGTFADAAEARRVFSALHLGYSK